MARDAKVGWCAGRRFGQVDTRDESPQPCAMLAPLRGKHADRETIIALTMYRPHHVSAVRVVSVWDAGPKPLTSLRRKAGASMARYALFSYRP
jgi:hypothetical protein